MEPRPLPGIPEKIQDSADRMMQRVLDGTIRKHLLGSTSHIRYSSIEAAGMDSYCDFVKSKLFFDIMELEGREQNE